MCHPGRPGKLQIDHEVVLQEVGLVDLSSCVGALLVYDVTKRITFDGVRSWLNETREHGNEDIIMVLVGNKADLVTQY